MRDSFIRMIWNGTWRYGFPTFFDWDLDIIPCRPFSSCMCQLDPYFTFGVFMYELYNLLQFFCLFIIPDSHTSVGDSSARFYSGSFYHNQSCSALCPACIMHQMKIIGDTIFTRIHTHRRHYPSVFQFYISELYWSI